jgi:hypothetical protein
MLGAVGLDRADGIDVDEIWQLPADQSKPHQGNRVLFQKQQTREEGMYKRGRELRGAERSIKWSRFAGNKLH